MTSQEMKIRIESLGSGTLVEMVDLTGTNDHWQAVIISPAFESKTMIEQHRMVLDLFKSEVESNEVHALTMKTFTPKQYEQYRGRMKNGL